MKAQVSLDFMLSILAAIMFFLLIIVYVNNRFRDASEISLAYDAKQRAKTLALAINDVYTAGDGSYDNLTLPETLYGGKPYAIKVYPRSVLISYDNGGKDTSYRLTTASIYGSEGGLAVNPGIILINNTEGTIYIRNE